MKSNLFYSTLCVLICVLTISNMIEAKLPDHWHTGLDSALETAQKEKKPIVIFVTGSDWCGPCKALKERVLSKASFYKLLNQKAVFAELDFPDGPIQPESLRKRNAYWRSQYNIAAFPTLLIADHKGRPVGNAYSGDWKVEAVAKSVNTKLDIMEQRNKLFAEASNASGRKKLELLTQAFKKFDIVALRSMRNFYADELSILKKLDPENKWVKYVREYAQMEKEEESISVGSVKERIKIVETRSAEFHNPWKFIEEEFEKDIRDAIKNNNEKDFVKKFRQKHGL